MSHELCMRCWSLGNERHVFFNTKNEEARVTCNKHYRELLVASITQALHKHYTLSLMPQYFLPIAPLPSSTHPSTPSFSLLLCLSPQLPSLSLFHPHTHTLSLTHPLPHHRWASLQKKLRCLHDAPSFSLPSTLSLTLALALSIPHTHTHTHKHKHKHTQIHTHTHKHTHTHTRTHTHTNRWARCRRS